MSPASEENHVSAVALHHAVDNVKAALTSTHWWVVFERVTIASNDLVELIGIAISVELRKIAKVETISVLGGSITRGPVR